MLKKKAKADYCNRALQAVDAILAATDREVLQPVVERLRERLALVQASRADLARQIRVSQSEGIDKAVSEARSRIPEHDEELDRVRTTLEALRMVEQPRAILQSAQRALSTSILSAKERQQAQAEEAEAIAKLRRSFPAKPGTPQHSMDLAKRLKQLEAVT